MRICTEHNEEVVHDGKDCPACELQTLLDKANERISELEDELEDLQKELDQK